MKWIKIEDVLPAFKRFVIVTDGKDVWIDYLDKTITESSVSGNLKSLVWNRHENMVEVTYWMPLPEPPKAKGE